MGTIVRQTALSTNLLAADRRVEQAVLLIAVDCVAPVWPMGPIVRQTAIAEHRPHRTLQVHRHYHQLHLRLMYPQHQLMHQQLHQQEHRPHVRPNDQHRRPIAQPVRRLLNLPQHQQ
jgi:hypothetical protein